jgi:aminoglycoside 3-N-acetyltransferase
MGAGIRQLGLAAHAVEAHSSLRSFGWVEGSAATVVNAFVVEGCTLLVPTFSDAFFVHPLPEQRSRRNAWDYARPRPPAAGADRVFTPAALDVDRDMGASPAAVLATPGRVRGNHPLMSFTAVGPLAEALIAGQAPDDVYVPLARLTEQSGFILMIGVGLTEMTFLHYAELLAGRRPFLRWANGPDGRPMMVQYGGCTNGFDNFEPVLASLARETVIGASRWRAFPARETLAAAVAAIRRDSEITACAERCSRCADAIAGGPLWPSPA